MFHDTRTIDTSSFPPGSHGAHGPADVQPEAPPLSAQPLYEQVRKRGLEMLLTGRWPPDRSVLRSEAKLSASFGVAIGTVRRALSSLTAEGLLARRRKTGTVVTGRAPHHSLRMCFQYFRLHGRGDTLLMARRVSGPPYRSSPRLRCRLRCNCRSWAASCCRRSVSTSRAMPARSCRRASSAVAAGFACPNAAASAFSACGTCWASSARRVSSFNNSPTAWPSLVSLTESAGSRRAPVLCMTWRTNPIRCQRRLPCSWPARCTRSLY